MKPLLSKASGESQLSLILLAIRAIDRLNSELVVCGSLQLTMQLC